ncbi:DNA-3-methyladenine glycosylase 2 family protein [Subtercola endophyticus]|uniref:DNA-3-methyladenine glycosylase 2 family protein n=1 Tax=Subtercola endophyticus TaxID=2895559 RepID=UPI001E4FBD65|nr:AlkA N-terminal domain-containing protein [Subtercola endophyticus]UFS60372.1 helix-turn-helix domain-containing protein [Subtercola endophyticus]
MTTETDPVFEQRYRAMKAKDARFDGQFITGVHSTGIYCRPSCPARTPQPQNVSFYLTAAAAHEAGLRACKRCFPDAVPGSPEWNLRDDLAGRAMRLIDDGVVDREGVDGLARRLGYTPRHLTRVLAAELGAGPQALARAHRAQSARTLLQSTDLPITQVVYASGFSSVRAFNDTISAVYEMSPSALREKGRRARGRMSGGGVARAAGLRRAAVEANEWRETGETGETRETRETRESRESGIAGTTSAHAPGALVTVTLPARAPFDGRGVIDFLAARAVAGVEEVRAGIYRRTLRLPHGWAVIELEARETSVLCRARLENLADLSTVSARVRRLFDLDADAQAIDEALASVPGLGESVRRVPGIRVPGAVDAYEIVFRALIGQQVSVAAARTALGRLADALGDRIDEGASSDIDAATGPLSPGADRKARAQNLTPRILFPTAAQIATVGREVLRGPAKRIDTIIRVAEALASGELVVDVGVSQAKLMADLQAFAGVGPWTAGYVAMRVLGATDILLDGDLALRAGATRLGLPGDRRELVRFAEQASPWRSYLGMHLWRANRSLEG